MKITNEITTGIQSKTSVSESEPSVNGTSSHPLATCQFTISLRFSRPRMRKIGTTESPRDSSYEIICELARMLPRNGYFELADHPARTMPYTPSDEIAKMKSAPTLRLAITMGSPKSVLPKGITASVMITEPMPSAGAIQ